MMTSVSPRSTASDTPRSTGPASKPFHTSSTSIRRSPTARVMPSPSPEENQEELREEEIRDDDAHGDVHDRVRGGAAETLRAALGGEAVVTADQRDDDAEEDALADSHQEITGHDPVRGDVPVGVHVGAALEVHHHHAAEHAERVGEHRQPWDAHECGQAAW